jgi:hypothetical protein
MGRTLLQNDIFAILTDTSHCLAGPVASVSPPNPLWASFMVSGEKMFHQKSEKKGL